MSRIDELKKQYPELNITVFDLMTKLDSSKSYKYLPLMCKLFGKRFDPKSQYRDKDEYLKSILEIQSNLISKGISTNNLTDKEMLTYYLMTDYYNNELFHTLRDFIYYMDQNQIDNKDVTSYSSIDEMRGAVTLASIKEFTKEMSNQVIKEYEDDTWIAVRPLTFTASARYGSGTRWCTTYQREKNYFERYWRQGILCYFINKKTGYKFAGFKSLQDREMSFWNSDDSRIDFLDVNIEDYMFSTIKKIYSSNSTNKDLCTLEIQQQVHEECSYEREHKLTAVNELEPVMEIPQEIEVSVENIPVRTMTARPIYDEPTLTRG